MRRGLANPAQSTTPDPDRAAPISPTRRRRRHPSGARGVEPRARAAPARRRAARRGRLHQHLPRPSRLSPDLRGLPRRRSCGCSTSCCRPARPPSSTWTSRAARRVAALAKRRGLRLITVGARRRAAAHLRHSGTARPSPLSLTSRPGSDTCVSLWSGRSRRRTCWWRRASRMAGVESRRPCLPLIARFSGVNGPHGTRGTAAARRSSSTTRTGRTRSRTRSNRCVPTPRQAPRGVWLRRRSRQGQAPGDGRASPSPTRHRHRRQPADRGRGGDPPEILVAAGGREIGDRRRRSPGNRRARPGMWY